MTRGLALCAMALAACCASADTIEQAQLAAQPQMNVKDGALLGCGYRITAVPKNTSRPTPVVAMDTSLNLFRGVVMLKGGAIKFVARGGQPGVGEPVVQPIETFWLKVPNMRPTKAREGKIMPAENKGYLIYGETADALLGLLGAIWNREALTIGMRIKGENNDRIYTGVAEVSDTEIQQVRQCIQELIEQLQHDKGTSAER